MKRDVATLNNKTNGLRQERINTSNGQVAAGNAFRSLPYFGCRRVSCRTCMDRHRKYLKPYIFALFTLHFYFSIAENLEYKRDHGKLGDWQKMALAEDNQVGDAADGPPPDEQLNSLASLENNNSIPRLPVKGKKPMVSSSDKQGPAIHQNGHWLSAGRVAGRQLQADQADPADPQADEPSLRHPFVCQATTQETRAASATQHGRPQGGAGSAADPQRPEEGRVDERADAAGSRIPPFPCEPTNQVLRSSCCNSSASARTW